MLLQAFWIFGAGCIQAKVLQSQNSTFNSTFRLTATQVQAASLSDELALQVEVALNYERSNNAGSLTQNDPFYALPSDIDPNDLPPPGSILKVEEHTDTTYYTIPPTLSMSRFLYVTETLNGTSVPASAYALWPFRPRRFSLLESCAESNSSTYPLIGLAHGTSGQTQACAPSNLRDLWDEFHGSFTMALAGYAVVAPDYAGLGVPEMPTPYFIFPSHANDLFHAIAAAQKQWSALLSQEFVIAGQSQGGGTIWSAAQRQAVRPVPGYLGAMAASPFTNVLADINGEDDSQVNIRVVGIAQGLDSVLSNFTAAQWLTEAGVARLKLLKELKGCSATAGQLFSSVEDVAFLQADWNTTAAASWYQDNVNNGGQPFAGPMLILQGTADGNAIESVTTEAVNATCEAYPRSKLHYSRYQTVTHAPIMLAAQNEWLDWIADRFKRVPVGKGCTMETVEAVRGSANVVKNQNWFIEYDVYGI